jgi:hypothetical protein
MMLPGPRTSHPGRRSTTGAEHVQWHWGNIGSAAAGLAVALSALFAAGYALITGQGPKWISEARARARDQAEAARSAAALSDEQRRHIQMDRERVLYGWGGAGSAGEVYGVALVTDPAEMDTARSDLAAPNTPAST